MYSGRTPDLPPYNNRRNNIPHTGTGSNDSPGLNLNVSGSGSGSGSTTNESDERTVYIRNLHENVTEDLLRELFIQVFRTFLKTMNPIKRNRCAKKLCRAGRWLLATREFVYYG